ncbi:MAG TPA: ribonuclease III [Beijerinckiaceae bacterium]|nr:ribonuclease III [Beijerinckiaceae bacterium]
MAADAARLAELEERLGHVFTDKSLLEQALTHVSHSGAGTKAMSYQRLEFLGDRVLGLCVADLLYARHPEAPEGQLSRALADLVRKETCAAVAESIGVGACLRMGKGERKSGLARKPAVLGDACEALLGAVYLDAGLPTVDTVVRRHWLERLPDMTTAGVDPKTALQEWAHTRGLPEPRYAEVDRTGPDHAPVFRVAALVEGLEPCEGQGRSKRIAERAAAEAMLAREGVAGGMP